MSEIVSLNAETRLNLEPDKMMDRLKGQFDTLIYAGRDKDGKFHAGSSIGDVGEMLVLIELFKAELMQGVE